MSSRWSSARMSSMRTPGKSFRLMLFRSEPLPLTRSTRASRPRWARSPRLMGWFAPPPRAACLNAGHRLVRLYRPAEAGWPVVTRRRTFDWPESKRPRTLGEQLTYTVRAIARANPSLQGVIDIVDYNETRHGEREISA